MTSDLLRITEGVFCLLQNNIFHKLVNKESFTTNNLVFEKIVIMYISWLTEIMALKPNLRTSICFSEEKAVEKAV